MLVLIEKAFARQIHYLGNYVSYITIQAVAQMLTLFYLHTVFIYTDTLNGWTREQAIFVFYLATMVTANGGMLHLLNPPVLSAAGPRSPGSRADHAAETPHAPATPLVRTRISGSRRRAAVLLATHRSSASSPDGSMDRRSRDSGGWRALHHRGICGDLAHRARDTTPGTSGFHGVRAKPHGFSSLKCDAGWRMANRTRHRLTLAVQRQCSRCGPDRWRLSRGADPHRGHSRAGRSPSSHRVARDAVVQLPGRLKSNTHMDCSSSCRILTKTRLPTILTIAPVRSHGLPMAWRSPHSSLISAPRLADAGLPNVSTGHTRGLPYVQVRDDS